MKYLSLFFIVAVLIQGKALAQESGPCENALSAAQQDYLNGAYQSAVSVLSTCLLQGDYDTATATEAYRLLSLSYLKLDELSSARSAVVQLLSKNPSYQPDPVNDLPQYRALVDLVREQLGLAVAEDPEPEVEEIQPEQEETIAETELENAPPLPISGRVLVSTTLGLSSYGGERGVDTESWAGEFARNAGPLMGFRAEYGVSTTFLVGISYSVAEYPHIITNKQFRERHQVVNEEASSKWVHQVSAALRGRIRGTDWLYPYGRGGIVTTYHYINESFSAGVGPTLALGTDFFIDPTMVLFFEMEAAFIFPGSAMDLADHYGAYDPVTSIAAGVRFRLSQLTQ